MSSLAFSDMVLAFASAFAASLLFQQKGFDPVHRVASRGALLGFILMALAAFTGTLRYGFSESWAGPYLMLNNVAIFMAPPLVTLAMALILSARVWTPGAWGRVIIALCLFYEVSRWYGLETLYRDLQWTICMAVCLVLILKSQIEPGPKAMLLASVASYCIGGLIIGNEGTLAGYQRLNLFRYFIALGNLMLGSGLYLVLRQSYSETEH